MQTFKKGISSDGVNAVKMSGLWMKDLRYEKILSCLFLLNNVNLLKGLTVDIGMIFPMDEVSRTRGQESSAIQNREGIYFLSLEDELLSILKTKIGRCLEELKDSVTARKWCLCGEQKINYVLIERWSMYRVLNSLLLLLFLEFSCS